MKILIIQLRRIGDILLSTPVITYLKGIFPDSKIDFLTEEGGVPVLETNPHLHEVLSYDKRHPLREIRKIRSRHYGAVLDFMNNPRSRYLTALSGAKWRAGFDSPLSFLFFNAVLPRQNHPEYVALRKLRLARYWLEKTGHPSPAAGSYLPEIYFSPEDDGFARDWMRREKLERGKFAFLIPNHRRPIRRWRADGFKDLGLKISRESKLKVYLACGPDEENYINEIRQGHDSELGFVQFHSIRQAGALFQKAALVVANDSGLMHVAVAAGVPTVTIYGPSRPIDWNPSLAAPEENSRHIVVSAKGVPCLGCHLLKCPVGHICMTYLSVEEVFSACQKIL